MNHTAWRQDHESASRKRPGRLGSQTWKQTKTPEVAVLRRRAVYRGLLLAGAFNIPPAARIHTLCLDAVLTPQETRALLTGVIEPEAQPAPASDRLPSWQTELLALGWTIIRPVI